MNNTFFVVFLVISVLALLTNVFAFILEKVMNKKKQDIIKEQMLLNNDENNNENN